MSRGSRIFFSLPSNMPLTEKENAFVRNFLKTIGPRPTDGVKNLTQKLKHPRSIIHIRPLPSSVIERSEAYLSPCCANSKNPLARLAPAGRA